MNCSGYACGYCGVGSGSSETGTKERERRCADEGGEGLGR